MGNVYEIENILVESQSDYVEYFKLSLKVMKDPLASKQLQFDWENVIKETVLLLNLLNTIPCHTICPTPINFPIICLNPTNR